MGLGAGARQITTWPFESALLANARARDRLLISAQLPRLKLEQDTGSTPHWRNTHVYPMCAFAPSMVSRVFGDITCGVPSSDSSTRHMFLRCIVICPAVGKDCACRIVVMSFPKQCMHGHVRRSSNMLRAILPWLSSGVSAVHRSPARQGPRRKQSLHLRL